MHEKPIFGVITISNYVNQVVVGIVIAVTSPQSILAEAVVN